MSIILVSAKAVLTIFCIVAIARAGENASPAQAAVAARKLQPPPQELLREVFELRLEVYRQGVELADWKIRQLDYSLAQAQFQLRALDDEERTILQDLTGPDTPDDEIGARRAECCLVSGSNNEQYNSR